MIIKVGLSFHNYEIFVIFPEIIITVVITNNKMCLSMLQFGKVVSVSLCLLGLRS